MNMPLHFTNPELQTKLDQWATQTGRSPEELVESVMTGYFDELAGVTDMLDRRYDDVESGKVKPIPADEVIARLRERSALHRQRRA